MLVVSPWVRALRQVSAYSSKVLLPLRGSV